MRAGRPLEQLQKALKAFAIRDDCVKILTIARASSLGVWMLMDFTQWVRAAPTSMFLVIQLIFRRFCQLHATGTYPLEKATLDTLRKRSFKLWFGSLCTAWILCAYRWYMNAIKMAMVNRVVQLKEDRGYDYKALLQQLQRYNLPMPLSSKDVPTSCDLGNAVTFVGIGFRFRRIWWFLWAFWNG